MRAKQIRRHRFTSRKNVEFFQIDDRETRSKRIVESALGNAAMQRHLAAFKTAAARIAATRLLPLVAGAGRLAKLGADTTADAHFTVARATRRAQRFQP